MLVCPHRKVMLSKAATVSFDALVIDSVDDGIAQYDCRGLVEACYGDCRYNVSF